jgi:dienelactone hydrolase
MARVPVGIVLVLSGILCSPHVAAWPGFTWDNWRDSTGVTKPSLTSPQVGKMELVPLQHGPDGPIETQKAWETKRNEIVDVLAGIFGNPEKIKDDPGPSTILGSEPMPGYRRIHLRIPGELGDPIPAYLLLPDKPIATPTPAMVVLHQTQAPGKREACGMVGNPDMAFADELAKRGYICVVPDAVGFGERLPDGTKPYHNAMELYERHPKWSYFGKMNYDVGRVIDFLEHGNEVDTKRIGVIGHSHGAYGSIMATVFEPRIALTVASCGFNTLRADPDPNRWSHLTALMPRLGYYVDDIKSAPFDWHEVVACIAPRPYFNWATLEDNIFPNTDNLAGIYTQLEGIYALYEKEDRFHGELVPGKHRFPKEGREMAYAWIDAQFGVARTTR